MREAVDDRLDLALSRLRFAVAEKCKPKGSELSRHPSPPTPPAANSDKTEPPESIKPETVESVVTADVGQPEAAINGRNSRSKNDRIENELETDTSQGERGEATAPWKKEAGEKHRSFGEVSKQPSGTTDERAALTTLTTVQPEKQAVSMLDERRKAGNSRELVPIQSGFLARIRASVRRIFRLP